MSNLDARSRLPLYLSISLFPPSASGLRLTFAWVLVSERLDRFCRLEKLILPPRGFWNPPVFMAAP